MRRALCGAALAALLGAAPVSAETAVDLELVLAIDSSASVDDHEFALQMAGIAAAFRDPRVRAAIRSGPRGRIGVAAFLWAESGWPKAATPWFVIAGDADAEAFARTIETFPRTIEGGTGIGSAVMFGVRLFEQSAMVSPRRVIDLSGDGKETAFREWRVGPGQARFVASAHGITVNGLAILTDEPDLARYYRDEVITGPDAFVIAAATIADFARAMRDKLLRELTRRPVIGETENLGQTKIGDRPRFS